MKPKFSKKVLAILASAVLLICSFAGTFTVSAEDAQVYDIGGVNHVFAHADGTLTYNGTAYGAYTTFTDAYNAIKATGGTIVFDGTHSLYTESTTTTAIKVIGVSKSTAILSTASSYWENLYGELYLKDLTLKCSGTVRFSYDRLTLDNVGQSGTVWISYARTGQENGATCYVNVKSGTNLDLFGNAETDSVSSSRFDSLHYIIDGGYVNWNLRVTSQVYGNMTWTFNALNSFGSDSNKKLTVSSDPTGALTVIFNNGVTGLPITDDNGYVDYRLNLPTGGYATVKTEGSDTVAPTFAISHTDGIVPVINGEELTLTDGEYLYQPTEKGTIDVTFNDNRVYNIGGETTVFAHADKSITYNGTTYVAYPTFKDAYNAIKGLGGTIVFDGAHALYTENTTTTAIKVVGANKSTAILNSYAYWSYFYGELYLQNMTIGKQTNSGWVRFIGDRLTLDNVSFFSDAWLLGMSNTNRENGSKYYLNVKSGTNLNMFAVHETVSGSSDRFDSFHYIIDGGSFGWDHRIAKTVYGNLTFTFNAAGVAMPVSADPTGALTVIRNNGVTAPAITDNNGYVDYILNVAKGGYATVKTEGTQEGGAPTFAITNTSGYVPVINGEELTLTDGEYLYQPTEKGTTDITFVDPNAPVVYDIEGENFAFVSADGKVDYNEVTYNAYNTFETAYKAIASVGGTIVLEDAQTLYTANTTTAAIKIVGLDRSTAILKLAGTYVAIYGDITIDNLTLSTPSGSGDANISVGQFTIGATAKSAGNLWFTGFNADNGRLNHFGTGGAFMMNMCALDWAGAKSFRTHFGPDAYVNWDIRVNAVANGNATYIFDSVARHNNKTISVGSNPTGALTLILNNGTTDLTVSDSNGYVDYRLNLAEGGYADIKTEGSADTAPTFVITNTNGYVPVVNGEQLTLTDGEYLYTPTTTGTIDITFVNPDAPVVYDIEGENFAFVSSTGKLTYNEVTYNAYTTFEEAYKAIIGVGGTIVVEGEQTIYTESTAAKAIKVLGLGTANTTIVTKHYGVIYGEIFFDNLTLSTGGSQHNFYVDRFSTGNNVTVSGTMWIIGFRSSSETATCYSDIKTGTVHMLSPGHESANPRNNVKIYIHPTAYVNYSLRVPQAVTGNVTFVINSKNNWGAKAIDNVNNNPTGAFSVIYNNGVTGVSVTDPNAYIDYVLNVAAGGYADIKTEGSASVAPTFVITAPEGNVPVVGGVKLEKTAGEYLYQPTEKTTDITFETEVSITVNQLTGAQVRFANPTGLRFVANIEGLADLGEGATYNAYTLIAPIDYVNAATEFTAEALENASLTYLKIDLTKDAYVDDGTVYQEGAMLYNAAIVNIKEGNYDRQFAARTFVEVTVGQTTTVFASDFNTTDHVRSVKDVALACIDDGDYRNNAELVILNKFAGLQ